jgi:hypothetical protein
MGPGVATNGQKLLRPDQTVDVLYELSVEARGREPTGLIER